MKAKPMYPGLPDELIMGKVVLSKNMVPCINTGLGPMTAFLGRNNLLSPLNSFPQSEENCTHGEETSESNRIRNHSMRLFEPREFLIKREAVRALRISATRRIRAGARQDFADGCEVDIFGQCLHRWFGGFAVLGKHNSHLLVEKGEELPNTQYSGHG